MLDGASFGLLQEWSGHVNPASHLIVLLFQPSDTNHLPQPTSKPHALLADADNDSVNAPDIHDPP